MQWRTALALPLLAALMAGCLSETVDDLPGTGDVTGLLFAGPSLYLDPQNAPHPAYNWPTISNPAIGANVPAYWAPIEARGLPATITDLELVKQTPDVPSGAGIAIFGSLVVVPGFGPTSYIVDISDPTNPVKLSEFEPQDGMGSHRGATIIAYPTGRLVTVISTGSGLDVFDITDPKNPVGLPPIEISSHKVGVVPGTPIVYNAKSGGAETGNPATGNLPDGGQAVTEMWDFSDPANPERLPDFENGYSCHHIYFWNSVELNKYRAICAGIEVTQLIDIADPKDPKVIVNVPVHHGIAALPSMADSTAVQAFSHYASLNSDGTMLMVGDENGGGGLPPGCVAGVDTPLGRVSTPVGAVWFYDVSDELDPEVKGYYSPMNDPRVKSVQTSCTAHHGRIVPADGRDLLAMSFYGAGVIVIDFSPLRGETPGLPQTVAQFADGSNTWETWYYQGYLVTGDLNRGVDVIGFV